MKVETSFSQKMKAGWTKERLKAYYALSESEYERVLKCLKGIRQAGALETRGG
jgi:hypothetical protein